MPSDHDAHANASRPDDLEAVLSALAALHDDARLVRDGIMAPSALTSSMQEAEDAIAWLRTEVAKRAGLDKLMQESLPHAEWQDKHIHPVGRETYQNWKVTVYLPVPLSEVDKSPQAALARAVEIKAPKPTAANARDDELAELRRQRDELRRALEIIAVGDAEDPKTQAAEELAAIGYWGSVPEPTAANARDDDLNKELDIPELDANFFDGATLTRPGERLTEPKTLTVEAFVRAVKAQAVRFDVALMAQALEALRNVPEVGGLWDAQHADHHMQADMALSARLRQISGDLDSDTATDASSAADPVERPSVR